MSLRCGIVGLPNVGKSTLFNCISSGKAQAANFPFCTIEPNVGSTIVPDERLNVLEKLTAYKGSILLICHEPDFYEDFATRVLDCSMWSTKM